MIQAFKAVRLTNNILSGSGSALTYAGTPLVLSTQTGQFVDSAHTGGFVSISQTGQFVDSAHTGGFVSISQTGQFVDSSKTGQFITTAQTGQFGFSASVTGQAVTYATAFTGISGVTVNMSGNQMVFSTYNITSATGQFVTTAQTGNFITNGMTGQYMTTAMTGGLLDYSDITYLRVTGASLSGTIGVTGIAGIGVSLSGNVILFSGTSSQTGQFVTSSQTGQFVTSSQTGQFVTTAQTGQFITTAQTGMFVMTGSSVAFITTVPTGIDTLGIVFPFAFSVAPKVIASIEVTGFYMYGVNVSQRSTTGYYALFTDTVQESGVGVHTYASL